MEIGFLASTRIIEFIIYNMLRTIFFLLIFTLVLSQRATIIISNLQSTIKTPGFSTSLAGFHNVYNLNMVGSGTYWLWNNEGMASPPGRTLTFQALFYLSCHGPLQLNITADDYFFAYMDGKMVAKGNNWRVINSINLSLDCGSHNFTVVATQGTSQYGPGIIYILSQNQSSCYNCSLNGKWNYDTCSCSCLTICGCALPQVWMDYPACTCRCPIYNISYVSDNQKKSYQGLIANFKNQMMSQTTCQTKQYFDHSKCSCQCLPQFCPEYYEWNSDPSVCACIFIP